LSQQKQAAASASRIFNTFKKTSKMGSIEGGVPHTVSGLGRDTMGYGMFGPDFSDDGSPVRENYNANRILVAHGSPANQVHVADDDRMRSRNIEQGILSMQQDLFDAGACEKTFSFKRREVKAARPDVEKPDEPRLVIQGDRADGKRIQSSLFYSQESTRASSKASSMLARSYHQTISETDLPAIGDDWSQDDVGTPTMTDRTGRSAESKDSGEEETRMGHHDPSRKMVNAPPFQEQMLQRFKTPEFGQHSLGKNLEVGADKQYKHGKGNVVITM